MTHTPKLGDRFEKGDWTFQIVEILDDEDSFLYKFRAKVSGMNVTAVLTLADAGAITTWIKPTPAISKEAYEFIVNETINTISPVSIGGSITISRSKLFDLLLSMIEKE